MRCQPRPLPLARRHAAGALAAFAAVALAACNSRDAPTGGESEARIPEAELANVETPRRSAAQLEAQAQAALRAVLAQPPVRLLNLREGFNEAICGQVELSAQGGSAGGTRPFLVTGRGQAYVSETPALRLEDPADPFPDLYMEWCASPEELRDLQDRIARLRPSDLQPLPAPTENLAGPAPLPEEAAPAPPAATPPRPQPRAQPRPPNDDSFFNAVVRPPPN